jgi:hypothetical protein
MKENFLKKDIFISEEVMRESKFYNFNNINQFKEVTCIEYNEDNLSLYV